jgi:hypothetical protein
MKDDYEWVWKESVAVSFEVLFRICLQELGKSQNTVPYSRQPITLLRFETCDASEEKSR